MKEYNVALIPGDGIGVDVIDEGMRIVLAAGPSMFEPVHGSAPDIVGRNIANPIGAIWAGAMMLDHLGETQAGAAIVRAIERLTSEGTTLTRDLGGSAGTIDVGQAIAGFVCEKGS